MPRRTTSVSRSTCRRLTNSAWAIPRNSSSYAGSSAAIGGDVTITVSKVGLGGLGGAYEADKPSVWDDLVALQVDVRERDVVLVPEGDDRQLVGDDALDVCVDHLALRGVELGAAGLDEAVDLVVLVAPAIATVGVLGRRPLRAVKEPMEEVGLGDLGALHGRDLVVALLDVREEGAELERAHLDIDADFAQLRRDHA